MTMSSTSIRFQQLVKGIDKVLVESRNKINVREAVQLGYGDEASVFAENQIEVVMEGMLDILQSTVIKDMEAFLLEEKVESDLIKVEEILQAFDTMEQVMKEIQEKDRDSARAALAQAQLPEGVKPMDVVKYRAFQIIQEEKERLLSLIQIYEEETAELEGLVRDAQSTVEQEIVKLEQVSEHLDRTADICATLS